MNSNMTGPFKPPGSSKTSQSGPWGGGSKYIQTPTPNNTFTKVPPFTGHTQKGNVTDLKISKK